jgi:hypothetical protein
MFFYQGRRRTEEKKHVFLRSFFLLVGFFHLNSVARKVETPFYLYQHRK